MNVFPCVLFGKSAGHVAWPASCSLSMAMAFVLLAGCGTQPTASNPPSPVKPALAKAATTAVDTSSTSKGGYALASAPKSAFRSDPTFGRDPFHPEARRVADKAPALVGGPQLPLVSYLKLAGIRPGKTRPLALINKTTFGPGEEADISIVVSNQLNRAEVQKVSVRCLEVRQDSVLITIAGEPDVKELRLALGKN